MDGNRWSVDRAAWVLFGVVLVGLVAEFLTPRSVQLTGFLLIPVLASVAYGRPALSAVLAVVASASAVSIQLWLGYDHRTVLVRSVLIAASGVIAVWLAASRARITRERAASEERYRLLAENAGDLVAHVRDGRFVWVSPSVEQVLGEPASHWVGRQFREVVHSDDQRAIAAGMATLERGESTVKERIQVVSPAGVKHWVDLRAAPFRDDNGESDGITMAMRVVDDEVAAQREADQARREQERADALYRRSMNSASVGYSETNTCATRTICSGDRPALRSSPGPRACSR